MARPTKFPKLATTSSTLIGLPNPISFVHQLLGGASQPQATMLAAHHDQENVFVHHAGATKQQLQAKTSGARFPKTPMKVPLNDENANHGFGGKSLLQTKGNGLGKSGKTNMVTPAGT